jgi:predicted Na+-dependent transporter
MKLIDKIAIFVIPIYVIIIMYNLNLFCGYSWESLLLSCLITLLPFIGGMYVMDIINKIKNKNK